MVSPLPADAHLLVGVDFSDGARAALTEARRLAGRMQLPLAVVYVRDPIHDAGTRLDPEAEQWLADAEITPDQLHVRSGQPWAELARAAAACGAVALVIGSHGRSGYQPVALGSTAVRLGLVAPCPTVVVNPRARAAHALRASVDHAAPL